MSSIIVLSGFSGSGKDTVLRELSNSYNLNEIVSYTTRPKRDNEIDGRDYHFISKADFLEKVENDEFIEFREYNTILNSKKDTWYYGINKSSIFEKGDHIVILDLKGQESLRKYIVGYNICSIFIDVPNSIRKKRAKKRASYCEVEFNRRLDDDSKTYPRDIIEDNFDFIVQNDDLSECLENIKDIINVL